MSTLKEWRLYQVCLPEHGRRVRESDSMTLRPSTRFQCVPITVREHPPWRMRRDSDSRRLSPVPVFETGPSPFGSHPYAEMRRIERPKELPFTCFQDRFLDQPDHFHVAEAEGFGPSGPFNRSWLATSLLTNSHRFRGGGGWSRTTKNGL